MSRNALFIFVLVLMLSSFQILMTNAGPVARDALSRESRYSASCRTLRCADGYVCDESQGKCRQSAD
uniref:SLPTX4 n=1 Tax=Hemiscolopendra marginata TaxID=943146 RepID=A0A646QID0_9MYRI